MKNWFYVDGKTKERIGPLTEAVIRMKFEAGEIGPNEMVWHEGLPAWTPAQTALTLVPVPGLVQGQTIPIPDGLRGWMSFVGVCVSITGIFCALTIIGLLPGIFMVVAGCGLLAARGALDQQPYIVPSQVAFFQNLAGFFRWTGWVIILTMLAHILLMLLFFWLFHMAMRSFSLSPDWPWSVLPSLF